MDHLQAGAVAAADVYSEVKELVSKNHHHHHHHHHGDIDEPSSTVFYSPSRNDQQQQLLHKGGRGNKKIGLETAGRPGLKGSFAKRSEKETSRWASVHDALHMVEAANEVAFVTKNPLALRDAHSSKEAQTMPFKSVQSPSMEPQQQQQQKLGSGSSSSEETKKKQTGLSAIVSATAPLRPSAQQQPQQQQPGSVMNGSGSIFSFNSTHSVRGAADCSSAAETYDYDSNFDKDSSASFDFNRGGGAVGGAYGPRAAAAAAAVGPLLKPTPSKWDDAEKWLSASCDQAPGLMNAKAAAAGGTTTTTTIKSKSGPLQSAHVVPANQQQGGGVTSKKVTFSNLGAAERQQSGTQNGSITTHLLPKATNAVADDHYGPGGDASASYSSSSSSSCENIGAAKYMRNKEEEGSGSGSSSEVEEAEAAIQEDSGTVAPDEAARFAFMPGVAATQGGPMTGGAVDRYPLNDPHGRDHHHHGDGEEALRLNMSTVNTDDKAPALLLLRTAKPISESATDDPESSSSPNRRLKEEEDDELQGGIHVPAVDLSLAAAAAAGAAVGSSSPGTNNTRGSVSTRDMGTEMTPIASVEPSRTATPVRATTPNLGSPINSRPSTPDRASIVLSSTPTSANNNNNSCASRRSHGAGVMGGKTTTTSKQQECSNDGMQSTSSSSNKLPLSGKELQAKTRQEILALGTQLGKPNIAAWATKEEEEADAAKALKASVELEEVRKNLLASRAAAWEEAEQAKYAARFKREEAKIQAWENHEKAKAEAEMRRIEVKVERMWSHANESMMNKLAAAHRRAEDLRAAAEARRSEQIAKAAVHAEHIRATGKMPTTTFFFARLCQ
ncbi:hypothetical protein CY35_15G099600 [Sphagnum magellanicum]|nr:hypothetical protein CY35_15G099600 [Sphagnum magellanicum]